MFNSEMLVSEIYISYVCNMKFYNREKEIKKLLEIKEQSKKNAQFSVITGIRRIGNIKKCIVNQRVSISKDYIRDFGYILNII